MTRLVAILFCTVLIILLAAQDKSSGQDYETADRWGTSLAKLGRWAVLDGLLAATAIQRSLRLVTRNARDVARTGVPVLNRWES